MSQSNQSDISSNFDKKDNNNDLFEPQSEEVSSVNNADISNVRERTFNKELSDLVDRIRSNESVESKELSEEKKENLIDITEENLLSMFHQLYYKSINLQGIDKINTDFNPFDLYKESSSDDLANLIYNEMQKISVPRFSIIAYNFSKICYTNYNNYIEDLNPDNIILDTSEELFNQVMGSNNGIILESSAIARNLYLKKRFGSGKALYFISFFNFFKDFYNDINQQNIDDFSNYLLPVLILELEKNITDSQKKSLYNKIKNKLTGYFFLLAKKVLIEIRSSDPVDFKSVFTNLEYIYNKFNRYKDFICLVIKCNRYVNAESLLFLEYLHIKLKKKLAKESAICRIEKDVLIVFTRISNRKSLDEIVTDVSKLYGNLFQVDMLLNEELSNNYLLQKVKEYLIK